MNSFEKYERMGLPGGPNEVFTYTTGVFDSGSIIQNTYRAPSNIHGQGMFAGKAFKRGDLIGLAHEDGQPASELGRMHNHSENDATMVSNKVGNQRFVYAARDIQPGEELTTNYRLQPELEQPEDFMMPMAQRGLEKYQTKGELTDYFINNGFGATEGIIDNTNVVLPSFDLDGNYQGQQSVNTNTPSAFSYTTPYSGISTGYVDPIEEARIRAQENYENQQAQILGFKNAFDYQAAIDREDAFPADNLNFVSPQFSLDGDYLGMGSSSSNYMLPRFRNMYTPKNDGFAGFEYLPYLGDAIDAGLFLDAVYNRNWSDAGIYGAGLLLPFVPGSKLKNFFRGRRSSVKPNKTFQSEIDWGKWNEEIPLNKELMQEYHTIEEVAKAKGTWMKNPDGSPFEGLPEQWVQQNSANYQKAFPNALRNEAGNIQISYHGSPNKFDAFDESKFYSGQYGVGVYTSPDKEGVLRSYANPSGKRSKKMAQITTGEEPTANLYELYINTNKPGNLDDLYDEKGYFGNIRDFGKTSDDLPTLEEWKKSDKGKRILEYNQYLKTDEDILNFLSQHVNFKHNVKENFRPVLPDYDFISVPSSRLKEQVTPFSNRLKSAVGNNGMFDMTNPNIYKQRGGSLPMAQRGNAETIPTSGIKPITYYDLLNAAYPGQYEFTTNTQRYYGDEPTINPRTQTITSKQIPIQYDYVVPMSTAYVDDGFFIPPMKGTGYDKSHEQFYDKVFNERNSPTMLEEDVRPIVDKFLKENIQDIIENPSEYYLTEEEPPALDPRLGTPVMDISSFYKTESGMPEATRLYLKGDDDDYYDELTGSQAYSKGDYDRLFDLTPAGSISGRLFELGYRPGYTQHDVTTTEARLKPPVLTKQEEFKFDRDKFLEDMAERDERQRMLSQNFLIDYLEKEPSRAGKTYYYYDDDEGNILYATGQPRFGTQGNQTGEEQEYLRQFEQFTNKDGTLRKPKVISSKDNPKKFQEVEDRIYDFAYQNIEGATPTFQGQLNPGGGILRSDLINSQENNMIIKEKGGELEQRAMAMGESPEYARAIQKMIDNGATIQELASRRIGTVAGLSQLFPDAEMGTAPQRSSSSSSSSFSSSSGGGANSEIEAKASEFGMTPEDYNRYYNRGLRFISEGKTIDDLVNMRYGTRSGLIRMFPDAPIKSSATYSPSPENKPSPMPQQTPVEISGIPTEIPAQPAMITPDPIIVPKKDVDEGLAADAQMAREQIRSGSLNAQPNIILESYLPETIIYGEKEEPLGYNSINIPSLSRQFNFSSGLSKFLPIPAASTEPYFTVPEGTFRGPSTIEEIRQQNAVIQEKGKAILQDKYVSSGVNKYTNIPFDEYPLYLAEDMEGYDQVINEAERDVSQSTNTNSPYADEITETEINRRLAYDIPRYGEFMNNPRVVNRTGNLRQNDANIFFADIAKPNSVIIDIGAGLGNSNPREAGISTYELFKNPKIQENNITVIASDIAPEAEKFITRENNPHGDMEAYSIPVNEEDWSDINNYMTPITDILKEKGVSDAEDIYLRATNGIDILMDEDVTKKHFEHLGNTLTNKNITYVFNNVILYKPKGEKQFAKIGNVANTGMDHRNPSWIGKDFDPTRSSHYLLNDDLFGDGYVPKRRFGGSMSIAQKGGGKTKYVEETDQGGYRVGVDVDRGDRQRSKSFSLEPSGDTSYSRLVTTPKGSRSKSIDIVDGEATKTITRTRNGETTERTKTLSDRKADRLSKKYARKVNRVFTDPFPEVPNPNEGKFTIEYEQGGEAVAPDFGSYGLSIEDTLLFPRYINYMNGNDESIEARRVYDKLNRKVYRYAKQGGMTAPDYMMTEVLRLGGSV